MDRQAGNPTGKGQPHEPATAAGPAPGSAEQGLEPLARALSARRVSLLVPFAVALLLPGILAGAACYALARAQVPVAAGVLAVAVLLAAAAAWVAGLWRLVARNLRAFGARADRATVRLHGEVPAPVRFEPAALARSLDALADAAQGSIARLQAALDAEVQNGMDLQRQYALMQLLRNLANAAHEDGTVDSALQASLQEIGDYLDWPLGRLVLSTPGAHSGAPEVRIHWYAPDRARYAAFVEACDRETGGLQGAGVRAPHGGLVGRALASSLSHWATDLARLEDWPAGEAARRSGLRTGFVIPVCAAPEVSAFVEFYSDHRIEASDEMLELIEAISVELWRIADRHRAEASREARAARGRGVARAPAGAASAPVREEATAQAAAPETSRAGVAPATLVAPTGDWSWDRAARRVCASAECRAILGLAAPGAALSPWRAWTALPRAQRLRLARLLDARAGHATELAFEIEAVAADGRARIVHIAAQIERDARGRALRAQGIVQDVTARRQAEERIRRLANYDRLTGLPNRAFQREQFAAAIAEARAARVPLALAVFDIDRFRHANDTLGEEVGDRILRELAWRLHAAVREGDTVAREDGLLAHPGGDEFTVLLARPGGAEELARVVRRLLAAVAAPFDCYGREFAVSACAGVALFPRDGEDADTLLRKAEEALAEAKKAGAGSWREYSETLRFAASS